MDDIDLQILKLLRLDSRMSNKQIGQRIHRTGQAVGLRIEKLVSIGVLKKYTIEIATDNKSYIRIFLKVAPSQKIEDIIASYPNILEFNKVAGQACYMVVADFSKDQMRNFLNHISDFASYSVENVVKNIK
ncbi:AsnC family transcriptional regulator [Acinetobacter sp. EC24]|nr:AsnC family transcriptional regulator [Acinetobacter rathckeae]